MRDTPQSLSRRVYPYNFVGQILKIFKCLRLKSNSDRRNFDKFTKILLKIFTNYSKLFRKLLKKIESYCPEKFFTPTHQQFFGKEILISD